MYEEMMDFLEEDDGWDSSEWEYDDEDSYDSEDERYYEEYNKLFEDGSEDEVDAYDETDLRRLET